jgi:hypothetical protein
MSEENFEDRALTRAESSAFPRHVLLRGLIDDIPGGDWISLSR